MWRSMTSPSSSSTAATSFLGSPVDSESEATSCVLVIASLSAVALRGAEVAMSRVSDGVGGAAAYYAGARTPSAADAFRGLVDDSRASKQVWTVPRSRKGSAHLPVGCSRLIVGRRTTSSEGSTCDNRYRVAVGRGGYGTGRERGRSSRWLANLGGGRKAMRRRACVSLTVCHPASRRVSHLAPPPRWHGTENETLAGKGGVELRTLAAECTSPVMRVRSLNRHHILHRHGAGRRQLRSPQHSSPDLSFATTCGHIEVNPVKGVREGWARDGASHDGRGGPIRPFQQTLTQDHGLSC